MKEKPKPKPKPKPTPKKGGAVIAESWETTPNGIRWRLAPGGFLQVALRKGQTVHGEAGAMIYMKGPVEPPTVKIGNFLGKLFASESPVTNAFTGTSETTDGVVAFGQPLPGDVIGIPIAEGQTWKISQGSVIASTANVTITGTLNLKALIPVGQGEGVVLTTASCPPGSGPGMVWVSSYGGFERHDLGSEETLILDNGVFLACDARVDYTLVKIGRTLVSSFFGGEGFGMKFTGPCTVYTQSRSTEDLTAFLAAKIGSGSGSGTGFNISIGGRNRRR